MKENEYNLNPEQLFKEKQPFFHVCSKPVDGILFSDDQDRNAVLMFMALISEQLSATILAYAIMSNHIHLVISYNDPNGFYKELKGRTNRYIVKHQDGGMLLPDNPTIVPIAS